MAWTKKTFYTVLVPAAAFLLLAYVVVTLTEWHELAGRILSCAFLSLATALRGSTLFKGLSYTLIILAAVTFAMYHPQLFKTIGAFKL
jgi:bile acid:Na+ symporter, BASS family